MESVKRLQRAGLQVQDSFILPPYILALWRSIYQLGIRGVERFQYWRLFFWSLFRRPRMLPFVIIQTIMGFHFRQVTELHVG